MCCKWVGGRVSSIYSTLIPWCPPSRRVCALVLRRLCALVPRCSGALILVYLGAPAPWCSNALVPWRFGAQEPWCSSAWVQLRHGALAPFECHLSPRQHSRCEVGVSFIFRPLQRHVFFLVLSCFSRPFALAQPLRCLSVMSLFPTLRQHSRCAR